MPVLGSVQYQFDADARPLIGSSKEAIRAFEDMDKAAKKVDVSLKGVTKSHSVLGGAIKGAIGVGGAVGVGLLTKHLLEGTKAGEGFNKFLSRAGGYVKSFGSTMSEGLRPFKAWLTYSEAGNKAVTLLEKGVTKAGEGFQRFDQAAAKGATAIKGWVAQGQEAAKGGETVSRTMAGAQGVVRGFSASIVQGGQQLQAWSQKTGVVADTTEKLKSKLGGARESVTRFGSGAKGVVKYLDEVGEGMTAVQLGALGMTGKLGTAAVAATHFSDIIGLAGGGLALMGGKIGILGAVLSTASAGVSGLTGLMAGLVTTVGMVSEAIGERLLAKTEAWIESFAQAQVTILGFNRAIKAYNDTVKGVPASLEDLEKWMSALGQATGTASVDIRQATLRALELSKVTGLTTTQVQQLTERSIDLASAMHRDLWDAVWSVLDAMRGFPMMASGFGIALDSETLKTSEFTKALGGAYDGLTELQKSQVMFQEMMKQSSWAAGIASETLSTTLVGAARKSEQAFTRLHTELGKGAALVWQPYTNAVAEAVSTFSLIPAVLVQAYGALTAFGGVALKAVGTILSVAGAMVTFNVALLAIRGGVPMLGNGLAWLLTKVTGTTVAFKGWGQILGVLVGTTFMSFGNILKSMAKQLGEVSLLLWGLARAHPVILAITAIGGAFLLLKKAIESQKQTLEESLKIYDKAIDKEKDRIKSLENIKEALGKATLSETEMRDLVLKAKDDYPALLKFLDKEKLSREELLVTLDKIIEARKEEEKYLKSKATAEVGKELGFYRAELERTRKSTSGLISLYVMYKKQMDDLVASHRGFGWEANTLRLRLDKVSEAIGKNTEREAELAKQEAKLTAEWERRHGVVKGVEQTLIKTATLQQHLFAVNAEQAEEVKESLQAIGDDFSKFEELRATAYQGRMGLIQKSLEFERAQSESTQEALRKDMDETFIYEQTARKEKEQAISAFNASIVAGATTASKGAVDAFVTGAQEYFGFLDRLQRENLEAQHAANTAFSTNARQTRAFVSDSLTTFKDHVAEVSQGAAEAEGGIAENASRLLMGLSRSYKSFSDLAQEAYAKIAGPQRNYLTDLESSSVATRDLAGITLSSVVQIEESYDRAVKAIHKANEETNQYGKTELDLAAQEKQLKELNVQRLKDLGEAWGRYYGGLMERQRAMLSSYKAALAELRGLEEDRLRRSQEMEEVIRGLREQAGEIRVTAQEKFYNKLKDQDTRLLEAQKLGARERIKVNEDVIRALTGMVGEIQEASGKVVLTEKQVAQIILEKVKKAWDDTKEAEKQASAEAHQDLANRKKDLQDIQDQLGVAQAGMAAFREAHKRAAEEMLQDEGVQLDKFAQHAQQVFEGLDLQLQSLTRERKINITLDERYLASIEQRLKFLKELLDDIASGKPITLRGPGLPAPPPKPPAVAPAPPAPAPPPPGPSPGYVTQEDARRTEGRFFKWLFSTEKQAPGQMFDVKPKPEDLTQEERSALMWETLRTRIRKQQGGMVMGTIGGALGTDTAWKSADAYLRDVARTGPLSGLPVPVTARGAGVPPSEKELAKLLTVMLGADKTRLLGLWKVLLKEGVKGYAGMQAEGRQQGGLIEGLEQQATARLPQGRGRFGSVVRKGLLRKDPRVGVLLRTLNKFGISLTYEKGKKIFDRVDQGHDFAKSLWDIIKESRKLPVLTAREFSPSTGIPGIALNITEKLISEQQELQDKLSKQGLQQGGQVAGKIPGFGGGDKVLIPALPGQFVVRKEAVSQLGAGLLAALSQAPAGKLGGFQPQHPVPVAVEPGEFVVPQEAVMARGTRFFEMLNKMQQGGQVTVVGETAARETAAWNLGVGRFPKSEALAQRGAVMTQVFGAALLAPRGRVESALSYAYAAAGILAGYVNAGKQRDIFRQRFLAAGGYLTPDEFEQLRAGVEEGARTDRTMRRAGVHPRYDAQLFQRVVKILQEFVSVAPSEGDSEIEESQGFQKGGKVRGLSPGQRSSLARQTRKGLVPLEGILEAYWAKKIGSKFAIRLLRMQGYSPAEAVEVLRKSKAERLLQQVEEGKIAPAKAFGLLQSGRKARGRVGGFTPGQAIAAMVEQGLIGPNTMARWMSQAGKRSGRGAAFLQKDTLYQMLREGALTPELFANTLMKAGVSRSEIAALLKKSGVPVSPDLLTVLASGIPQGAAASALEGRPGAYGDIGAMAGVLRELEWAPSTDYSRSPKGGGAFGLRKDVDLTFLRQARGALGIDMGGFDAAPPPAFVPQARSPQGSARVGDSLLPGARRSAGEIEGVFAEMFGNLEKQAKHTGGKIGSRLFENIYVGIKDRLIREERQG